jgi:hypothetical protein
MFSVHVSVRWFVVDRHVIGIQLPIALTCEFMTG